MGEILTPRCPLCGSEPEMVLGGGTQAVCGNEDGCTLIFWNMLASLDDNLLDAGVARWEPTEKGGSDDD